MQLVRDVYSNETHSNSSLFSIVSNTDLKNSPLFLHHYYLIFTQSELGLSLGIIIMNTISKIALISTGLISMSALTACQTTQAPQQNTKHAQFDKKKHKERLSPEQREQFKQARQERKEIHQQLRQVCDGKAAGTTVQIKTASQTTDGTCQVRFTADRKALKNMRNDANVATKMKHHDGHKRVRGYSASEPLTDAERAELVKKFDQRLAQRQAHQQAQLAACKGQSNNKQVQIKVGDQTINGVCKVYFKPQSSPSKS